MKTFEIYIHPHASRPEESAVLVKDGFSLLAGIFQGIWTLFHRLWLVTLVLFMAGLALYYAENQGMISGACAGALRLGLFLLVGFEGREWWAHKLRRKGFVLADVIVASSADEALKGYLSHMLREER